LLVNGDEHPAVIGVEAVLGLVVADLSDSLASDLGVVYSRCSSDLPGDQDQAIRGERLAGDASVGVLGEHSVEDRIRDLIAHLIGVALGYGLRSKKICAHRDSRGISQSVLI
jgi:hypothetical protein